MRSFLALSLSLALTGVLLVMNLALLRSPGAPAGTVVERLVVVTAVRPARPTAAAEAVPAPAVAAPFHWRAVESADYAVYAANLRAIGAPPVVVRDILLADLEKHFAKRQAALEEETEDTFWLSADIRDARDRDRELKLHALEMEKRALIRQLLGAELSFKALQDMRERGFSREIVQLLFGFTGLAQLDHLVTVHHLREADVESFLELREGILLDEDVAALRALRERFEVELAQQVSPSELEELRYRLAVFENLSTLQQTNGVPITGPELREIARLRADTRDFLARVIQLEEHIYSEEARQQGDAAFEELLRRFLGTERYADVVRARDRTFVELFQSTAQLGVQKSALVEAHTARTAAARQAQEIRADKALSTEERALLLATLRAATTDRLARTLGPAAFTAYAKNHGQSLTNALSEPPQRRRPAAP
ncbi:MAG: hypothetical protein B9S33_00405 [Pedosphaera sp. Tous-C6FEB]|nr:MAG: hypothetical protein B9S33_00405 [Pedosphaera sp. Tous-C6FEB]